ncbi:MAG: FAD-dependent oxidoreductase [Aerococcus sp.]|nr:FAD-dependent oxidoreductase [Aerococcus sp.]
MGTNIVVIGAGFAGATAARRLSKRFKKEKDVTITLIDRHSYQTYLTELHEVAAGRVEPDAIKYDLQRIFARMKNVQLVTDNVVQIDHDKQEVVAEHGTYPFDYVLIAMGSQPNDFGVPGVKENGFTLWSMEDAERVREHIIDMVYKAAREHDEMKRRELLSFVVSGAGFTGVEMIGELAEWLPILAEEHQLNPDEMSCHLVEAAPSILNTVTEVEQKRALKYMEKVGIQVSLGDAIKAVDPKQVELASGKVIPTQTCIWTAGVQANREVDAFNMEQARAGRLVADEHMQAKGFDNVFIAGDVVYYEEPDKDNAPAPQIVQAAEQTGLTAGENIYRTIKGEPLEAFKGKYDGNMVSIGSHYGVARLFDKYSVQGFWAMLVKHVVNIRYFLISIFNPYYTWKYIADEFFYIKHKRNIFGGALSFHGNLLWTLPLRLFYGSMWFVEGLTKCFGMFGGESWFGDTLAFPFPWLQEAVSGASQAATSGASEAVSGASQAVSAASGSGAAESVQQIFSLNYVYGEQPMLVFQHMPHWFEAIMKVMLPNRDVAFFMQHFMAIFELVIGACLIIGLFTWLFSGITVVLVSMFCLSGMFVWANMWFIPAAIALMSGAGRAFGLDYYVIPWIARHLDRWWFGKPNHIYGARQS